MIGLLSDVNFEGRFARLLAILNTKDWFEMWNGFGARVETFASSGLHRETNDRFVWERCQAEELLLITRNRNEEEPDSLEAALQESTFDSLPVLTIADADRILHDSTFARDVAVDLLNLLHEIRYRPESVLGSGRIYLPRK